MLEKEFGWLQIFLVICRKSVFEFKTLQETFDACKISHSKTIQEKSQLEKFLLIRILATVNSFGFQLLLAAKKTENFFPEFKNLQDSCKILARFF